MQISRESFWFKVAFRRPLFPKKDGRLQATKGTNLCTFFWRIISGLFIYWPFHFCVKCFALALVFAIFSAVGLFSFLIAGYVPNNPFGSEDDSLIRKVRSWPTFRGKHIWPVTIWGPIFLGYLVWMIGPSVLSFLGSKISRVGDFLGNAPAGTYMVLVAIFALISLGMIFHHFRKSDGWKIFRAYLKAKKDKVCPIITIVDNGPTNLSSET